MKKILLVLLCITFTRAETVCTDYGDGTIVCTDDMGGSEEIIIIGE